MEEVLTEVKEENICIIKTERANLHVNILRFPDHVPTFAERKQILRYYYTKDKS